MSSITPKPGMTVEISMQGIEKSRLDAIEAAESLRKANEAKRTEAETARANAEALRQQTFEANEANRQTAYESAESARESEWTEIKSNVETSVGSAVASASAATDAANTAADNANAAAEKSVRYDVAQKISDAQKAQARGNIDAADKESVDALKGDLAAITPDDNAVDGKPWTSKKTVDSLCQPFEESGNPVQVYPVENYPLGVKVSWEPTQEGEGDPSPDNIRPIKGRDSVKVERCGENLLNIEPFNKFTKNGITFEYVPDGGIHMSGTATVMVDGPVFPFWHLPPGKYYGLDSIKGGPASIVVQRNGKPLWLNAKGIFEILAGDVAKYWYVSIGADTTIDETIYPYIVPGTTAPAAYEPYIGDTYTAELPEPVYGGELDWITGVLTVTHGQIASYAGETLPGEWISDRDVYAPDAVPTTGAQVAYKLDEPRTIQLSTQQIAALSGVNTLYTDSGDISVSGRTDMIWLTQSLIDRIAALETAAVSE